MLLTNLSPILCSRAATPDNRLPAARPPRLLSSFLVGVILWGTWLGVGALSSNAFAQAPNTTTESSKKETRTPDVIFVPTPQAVVDKMLELAEIKKGDVVYDLGCGDGRIVVAAAKKYGVKAVGFDINPERVKESIDNVKSNKVEHLVTIKEADIFTLDLREANVVTLYLLPSLNVRLMPQLEKLKPGSRIVSHDFDMKGAKPVQVVSVTSEGDNSASDSHTVYKWTVPWEKDAASP